MMQPITSSACDVGAAAARVRPVPLDTSPVSKLQNVRLSDARIRDQEDRVGGGDDPLANLTNDTKAAAGAVFAAFYTSGNRQFPLKMRLRADENH